MGRVYIFHFDLREKEAVVQQVQNPLTWFSSIMEPPLKFKKIA